MGAMPTLAWACRILGRHAMTIHIAEFTADDCEEVIDFWRLQEGVGLNESDTPEAIAAYLRRNPGMSFLARRENQVVAAVLCGHDGRRGYLNHLAVDSSHRRQGIGRRLVRQCLDRLRQEGILRCNIFLFTGNSKGEEFWQALGFKNRSDLKVMQRPIKNIAAP
jgi:N-acetylglutamate synthase